MASSYSGRMAGAMAARRDMESDRAFRENRARYDEGVRFRNERDVWDRAITEARQRREAEIAERNRAKFDMEYQQAQQEVERQREEAKFGAWPKFVYGVESGMDPEVVVGVYNSSIGKAGKPIIGFSKAPDGSIDLDFGDGQKRAIKPEQVAAVMRQFGGGQAESRPNIGRAKELGAYAKEAAMSGDEESAWMADDERRRELGLPPVPRERRTSMRDIAAEEERERLRKNPPGSWLRRKLGFTDYDSGGTPSGRGVGVQGGTGSVGSRRMFGSIKAGEANRSSAQIVASARGNVPVAPAVGEEGLFDVSGWKPEDISKKHRELAKAAETRALSQAEMLKLRSLVAWAEKNKDVKSSRWDTASTIPLRRTVDEVLTSKRFLDHSK